MTFEEKCETLSFQPMENVPGLVLDKHFKLTAWSPTRGLVLRVKPLGKMSPRQKREYNRNWMGLKFVLVGDLQSDENGRSQCGCEDTEDTLDYWGCFDGWTMLF